MSSQESKVRTAICSLLGLQELGEGMQGDANRLNKKIAETESKCSAAEEEVARVLKATSNHDVVFDGVRYYLNEGMLRIGRVKLETCKFKALILAPEEPSGKTEKG